MRSKKIWIIVSVLIVIAIAVIIIIRRKKTREKPAESNDKEPTNPPKEEQEQNDFIYPWQIGKTTGPNVKGIQNGLNLAYDAGLEADGIFGPKTQAAMKKYLEISTITSYENRMEIIRILKTKIKNKKP